MRVSVIDQPRRLDISFTAAPTSIQIIPGYEHDPHARFWTVASLLYSPDKEEAMKREPQPSKVHGVVLPPDDHLACFDYLYYLCAQTVRGPLFLCVIPHPHMNVYSPLNIISMLALPGGSSSSISVGQRSFRPLAIIT